MTETRGVIIYIIHVYAKIRKHEPDRRTREIYLNKGEPVKGGELDEIIR